MAQEFNIRTKGELPPDVTLDKSLEDALNQIRTVPGAAEKFASDPEGYLKGAGIDTSHLTFTTGEVQLSEADLEQVAGGLGLEEDLMAVHVCASGGYYVCVTVGN